MDRPWRWVVTLLTLLLVAIGGGCGAFDTAAQGSSGTERVGAAGAQGAPVADGLSVGLGTVPAEAPGDMAVADASDGQMAAAVPAALDRSGVRPPEAPGSAAAAFATGETATVEALLADGLHLAGASPVHLAIRGTPTASSVRCEWRGIARTAAQREDAIRFWLRLGADATIPDTAYLETLFSVVLDTLAADFRETAKANFRAIARGGESMEYLFLTCFADYAVTGFLLGSGTTPTSVTVAYDRRGEAAAYELYVREHEAGTFGTSPRQTRGAYEAGLQAQVVAAEAALSAEIGGREAVVFLAPMGAHNAIGFEAWQAVASWAVVTDDAGVVQAIRDDTPAGDPEHTQTLANLSSRVTTAAAADGQAANRATTVGGLQPYYRDTLKAYADITPGDGQTTTFTPAQPPAAPTCTNGTVIPSPADNRELVKDCETLLAARDTLRGTTALNWATVTALTGWTGVTTGGTPTRVTGLSLASQSLSGTIPPALGQLFALTTLNLSSNSLTGAWTTDSDTITGATHTVDELICATAYEVRVRARGSGTTYAATWSAPSATLTVTTGACPPPAFGETAYAFSVAEDSATGTAVGTVTATITGAGPVTYALTAGNDTGAFALDASRGALTVAGALDYETTASYGLTVTARDPAGGSSTAAVTVTVTDVDEPPAFGAADYAFTMAEDAAVGAAVGTVPATDPEGGAVTYAITAGNEAGAFAIDAGSGALRVAAALDYETADDYNLTVTASDAQGTTATADVAVTVTDEAYPPGFGAESYAWSVAEDSAVGAALGTVSATDPEGGAVSYAITAGNDAGAVAIDASSGALTVAAALDYETAPSYGLTVTAGSSDGAATATVPVTVTVTNVNEAPVFGATSYAFSVAEDAQLATTIGAVQASDPEGGTVVYDITAGDAAQAWAVHALTGGVVTGARLNAATTPSYTLTIRAAVLEGGPSATTTVTVTVTSAD